MLSQHAELETERIVARQAIFAGATADARIEHDRFTGPNPRDCGTGRIDGAHGVSPQYPGGHQPDTGHAPHGPQVDVVEGGGADAKPDIAVADERWQRQVVAKTQLFQATVC